MTTKNINIEPMKLKFADDFRTLVHEYIGREYIDIDKSFAENIISAHKKGFDPLGYFTKNKLIWAVHEDDCLVGFAVASEKRGGSVKIGPTIVNSEHQNSGVGTLLWDKIEAQYSKNDKRKLYGTWPTFRLDFTKFANKLGWSIETQLSKQYGANQDEYIGSKFLRTTTSFPYQTHNDKKRIKKFYIEEYEKQDYDDVREFLIKEMKMFYDEIDSDFVRSLIAASQRFKSSFREKGKKIFTIKHNHELFGCIGCTPKRGGSLKISPFVIQGNLRKNNIADQITNVIETFFEPQKYRKIYSLIPLYDIGLAQSLSIAGYRAEGLIREPYKDGVDNLFYSKFLRID